MMTVDIQHPVFKSAHVVNDPQCLCEVHNTFQHNPVKHKTSNQQLTTHKITFSSHLAQRIKLQEFITTKVFAVQLEDSATSHEWNMSFELNIEV